MSPSIRAVPRRAPSHVSGRSGDRTQLGGALHPHRADLDIGYNHSYTLRMKTAISIPDSLFEAAEMAAERLGLSRSQLYARAVAEYLSVYGAEGTTERLDKVYADQESRLDPVIQRMQLASIAEKEW